MTKPSGFYTKSVGNAIISLCSASPGRTAVTFSTTAHDVFISPDPAIAAGKGIRVVNGQAPVELCRCHQGDWVERQLFAISPGGATFVYVIEGFEPWPTNQSK